MWLLLKEVWHVVIGDGKGKLKIKGFAGGLQAAYWLTLLFVLYVSVPHAVAVLEHYEPGGNELNAVCMALAIELVPALAFLVAMHFVGLRWEVRTLLIVLALPFVVLSFLIQSEAFDRAGKHSLDAWILALALPYGVIVTSLGIAIITSYVSRHKDNIADQVRTAVEAVEGRWREMYEQGLARANSQIEAYKQDCVRLQEQLKHKQALLEQPDPLRSIAEQQLEETRQALADEKTAHGEARVEARTEVERLFEQLEAERRGKAVLETKLGQAEGALQAMQISQSQQRQPQIASVQKRFNPPMQTSDAPSDGDANDEVKAMHRALKERFKSDPSVQILREAYNAGVGELTLKSWVRRDGAGLIWGEISDQVRGASRLIAG